LIDCGEGTQRQMKIAGVKLTKITKILLSHWHGDHVLGLPGLIQSLGALDYNKTLKIFGPIGTKKYLGNMLSAFVLDKRIKIDVYDISQARFYEADDFYLEAYELKHGIRCLGYSFIEKNRRKIDIEKVKQLKIPEGPLVGKLQMNKPIVFNGRKISPDEVSYIVKGKKLSFICDTLLCENCYNLAKDADVLVCEAVYSSKLEEKAEEYKHLTAKQAGLVANKANAKKLILTHFSARYKNTQEIEEDARNVFDNVICAQDLMKIKV
jgi:ribonuclease Z